jgi:hypothetical protein
MRIEVAIDLVVFVVGILVAIAPWTFAPVCASPMRCWSTRDTETILGAVVAVLGLAAAYKAVGRT